MKSQTIINIFGILTAGIVFCSGIVILFGMFPFSVSINFRVIFGTLLIVYALYRGTILWLKHRSMQGEEKNEDI
jgi:uncharacterized membrane protein (DUF373 family)